MKQRIHTTGGAFLSGALSALLLGVILFAAAPPAAAQPEFDHPNADRIRKVQERLESMRIWKLTEALQLNEKEAARFFPRYRQYRATMDSLEAALRQSHWEMRRALEAESGEVPADSLITTVERLVRRQHDVQFRFFDEVRDVLDAEQRVTLALFEPQFHRKLHQIIARMMMEHKGPGGGPPHGRHKRDGGSPRGGM